MSGPFTLENVICAFIIGGTAGVVVGVKIWEAVVKRWPTIPRG